VTSSEPLPAANELKSMMFETSRGTRSLTSRSDSAGKETFGTLDHVGEWPCCPVCLRFVNADGRICPHCGTDVEHGDVEHGDQE
jgi:hypothetical protein